MKIETNFYKPNGCRADVAIDDTVTQHSGFDKEKRGAISVAVSCDESSLSAITEYEDEGGTGFDYDKGENRRDAIARVTRTAETALLSMCASCTKVCEES